MHKKIHLFIFAALIFVAPCFAENTKDNNAEKDINYFNTATQIDISGDEKTASQIYYALLQSEQPDVQIASAMALAQKFVKKEDFYSAIKYYKWILQCKPDFAQARFELALCYMKLSRWNQADYQLRLALAGDNLSDDAKNLMLYYRYLIKQNKNWNFWFNFGAAPDNNINNGNGGTECIITGYGRFCRDLQEPESSIGINFTLGGNYEFNLSDNWRWKTGADIYSNTYNNHDFDDLYISGATGPRYIWSRGDIWLSGVLARRWYGGQKYNWALGAKIDTNFDWSRKLSSGLTLSVLDNKYDVYGKFLNGQTYNANMRFIYSFSPRFYAVLRSSITRETTTAHMYSYWQPGLAFGFGAELGRGFHIYAEPAWYFSQYDDAQLVPKNDTFTEITERDFIQRYAVAFSNNKFEVWGFVPTLTLSYTRRDSNIWQREYDKTTLEFTMRQQF